MSKKFEWNEKTYRDSLSSRCWWYSGYDGVWNEQVENDADLQAIVELEYSLGPVPEWAEQIATIWINLMPPCGHYLFPQPYLDIVTAIGNENVSVFRASCYCVERNRKKEAMDYCFCLDAWLAGASPEAVADELLALGYRKIDWQTVCHDLWDVLGERTEPKEIMIELTLHSLRHAIKASRWEDDLSTDFGRDQYVGDFSICPDANAPVFWDNPRVKKLHDRLKELGADLMSIVKVDYVFWWLCAPKAFRFLERDLCAIANGRPVEKGEEAPGFLQCEDTYINQDEAAAWYREFIAALNGWCQGTPENGGLAKDIYERLGETTQTKQWLMRLLQLKFKRLEENRGEFAHLVSPKHHHKRGKRLFER